MLTRKSALPIKISAGIVLGAFVAIQFFRPEKNLPQPDDSATDIFVVHPAPPEVRTKIEGACYDCHSNRTSYPWYAEIQPLGWWLDGHIRDGKRELNLSTFAELSESRQLSRIEAMIDAITDRSMPLPSYTWLHPDAKFTDKEISALTEWAESFP